MKNGTTLSWRVQQLEEQFSELDKKVDLILTNHMPHLHESIAALKTRINVMTAINVGAIVLGLLLSKFL